MCETKINIRSDLFKDVQFALCEDVPHFEQVKKMLLEGGGKFFNYLSDNVTHLISDNSDHPSVSEALEIYEKPVVTSRWVWLCVKSAALLPTTGFSPFPNQIFSNVTVCPSHMNGTDIQSIWAMVTYYGGCFQLELDSRCTHLISTKPEGSKYERAVDTNDKIKIVTPDWIIDSVKSKTLCDEDLYHPRLLIFTLPSAKPEVSSVNSSLLSSSSIVVSAPIQSAPGTNIGQQHNVTLKTVSLPSTTMITTLALSQAPYHTQPSIPNASTGGRVRVFLPPQHQVRLMQMQNQIRQPRAQIIPGQQQILNVQQVLQRQPLPQQQQSQQFQQQTNISDQTPAQWNNPQGFVTNPQTQPVQVYSQGKPEFGKMRPATTTIVQQQSQPQQAPPRQVYLAVQQQQQIRQQQLVQLKQQFISVQQTQQQPRQQSNIVIQQRPQMPININGQQQMRLQQSQPQQLIQLQQRQPVALQQQQGQQNFLRGPQQIIIQQQNQHAMPRHMQMQHQGVQSQAQFPPNQQQNAILSSGAIGHPQVQQRMIAPPRLQQFPQQAQLQRNQIRVSPAQQIVSTTMPTGQPRVFMKSPPQYPQPPMQQQFDSQGQVMRTQFPQQPQMQFIRGHQWQQSGDSVVQGQQQIASIRPSQHILVTTQQQPSQQQMMQWQQQQQEIQRRQMIQQPLQRFQLQNAQEKVRPSVSIVNVSPSPSAANTNTDSPQLGSVSSIRIAQSPAPSPVAQQVNVVSTPNTNASVASPVVTPKTKTALANLLNNRLQSGVGANKGDGGNCSNDGSSPSASGSLSLSSSVSINKTGFIGSPGVVLPSGEIMQPLRHEETQQNQNLQQIRFYGFDPRIQIPSDLFLLGCVFCIVDYENHVDLLTIAKWKKTIVKFGGDIEESYGPTCTHVLCENQQNTIVQQALRENKRCITIYWLNDVIGIRKMFPPTKALHLPCAFNEESKPCKSHIITATNFENEERQRIKDMIERTGAKFTSYMSPKNTMLICKKLEGIKYKKAQQWRIAIVNVQWLNEVLFGHFDVLHLSTLPKKYQQFDAKDPFKIDFTTIPNLMNSWRVPMRVSEELIKAKTEEKQKAISESKISEVIPEAMDIDIKKEDDNGADSENCGTPSKLPKLNDKSPKQNSFPLPPSPIASNFNTSLNPVALNPEIARLFKVMLTGAIDKNHLKSIIISIGGRVTNVPNECTHMVTDRIARTVKFLCAFSSCKFILSPEWVIESGRHGTFANEYDYILNDPEGETIFQFNLSKSMQIRNRELFKGKVFYLTNGCIPSPRILKDIIESANGIAVLKKRPTKRQLEIMRKTDYHFIVITCENDLHLCDYFFENNVDVVNVEFVLSGILKQEININEYAFKKKCFDAKS